MLDVVWTLVKKPGWLQRALRANATWPGEREIAELQASLPDACEDGAHPCASPYYFEWWYFDASFQGGSALSLSFHMTDIVRPAATSGSINVTIYTPGRPPVHRFIPYPRDQICAAVDTFDVRAGNNHLWMVGDRCYAIKIHEPGLQMELEFEPVARSWRPGNGRFEFGRPETFFAWVIMQPKARVKGWIQYNGERSLVEGSGYHDHNWGTVPLLDALKYWSWGRVTLDNLTCVYADIHLSERYGGHRVMPFVVLDPECALVSSFLEKADPLDRQRDFLRYPAEVHFPAGWELDWQKGSQRLRVRLRTREVLEKTDLLTGSRLRKWLIGGLIAHPFYIRCLADAQMDWEDEQAARRLAGTAICEQLNLQR